MLAAGDARDSNGIPGYEATRDYVGAHVHGLGVTHVDALCHMMVAGRMYNGAPASDVRSDGARRNSVMALAGGVVGRGVLLDLARVRGVPYLDGNTAATLADLEAAEGAEAVRVGPGDVLLVSTGRDARRAARGGTLDPAEGMAGLHPECLPFLHERGIAVLGSDGISDPMPGVGVPGWPFPVHQIGITAIGLHLIDNMALGALAEECAARTRWSFLFTLAPLRVEGGTGCPVNPIAVL
jgi:kynurenine formamidase